MALPQKLCTLKHFQNKAHCLPLLFFAGCSGRPIKPDGAHFAWLNINGASDGQSPERKYLAGGAVSVGVVEAERLSADRWVCGLGRHRALVRRLGRAPNVFRRGAAAPVLGGGGGGRRRGVGERGAFGSDPR